jgi:hypothetical protein
MVKKVVTLTNPAREFGFATYVGQLFNIINTHHSGWLISPCLFFFFLFFLFFFFLASWLLASRISPSEEEEREEDMMGEEGKGSIRGWCSCGGEFSWATIGEFRTKGVENNHTGNPTVKPGRFNVAM